MSNMRPDVDDLVRTAVQADVPAEVDARLRRRLAEFRTKLEVRRPSPWRWIRVAALTAAAIAPLVLVLMVLPLGSRSVYAQAVAQIRAARSVQYKLVLAPYTEVQFRYLAPGYRRVDFSWGVEIRTDNTGRQMVLLHWTHQYAMEKATSKDPLADAMALLNQLRALPAKADETLGERQLGGKRLRGYRVRRVPEGNVKQLDLWVDGGTGQPVRADITVEEAGKPAYRLRIEDIRLDGALDPSEFSTTPPAGYQAIRK